VKGQHHSDAGQTNSSKMSGSATFGFSFFQLIAQYFSPSKSSMQISSVISLGINLSYKSAQYQTNRDNKFVVQICPISNKQRPKSETYFFLKDYMSNSPPQDHLRGIFFKKKTAR
jgi:hypothetical protein